VKPVTPGPGQPPEAPSFSPGTVAAGAGDSGNAQQTTQTAQAAQAGGAKVTLQAASFPTEGSAKQFQDRLVQAGLPAYVVAADIPHRGKWYRVRAGKFASQDEARQAAASWRKQMAAAGINSQLVPCEYQ
jgi:cell division septation protein DedD